MDNYILKYYESADIISKKNMNRYLNGFYKMFLKNPTEFLDSPFLKDETIIDIFCPEEIKDDVKKVYIENIGKANIDKISVKPENASKEEIRQYMQYLLRNLGTEDKKIQKMQDEYIKTLIKENKPVKDLDVSQVKFIAQYANNKMLTSRLNELGYSKDALKNYIYIGTDDLTLGGQQSNNSIYINKDSILTKTIADLIQTICHETEHSIQRLESKEKRKTKIGLEYAIYNILREKYGKSVYKKNYRFEEIERDAEEQGERKAYEILSSLGFTKEAKEIYTLQKTSNDNRRFEYDFRIDESGKKSCRENFMFKKVSGIIKENPDLVKKYPSLGILYRNDGKPKSFREIIVDEFLINEVDKSEIYEDFLKHYISQGALDDIKLDEFPEEIQARIASRLIGLLGTENNQITEMGKAFIKYSYGYDDLTDKDKSHIEEFHLTNSKKIMEFINRNYQYLHKLQDKGKFTSIIDMSYYDSYSSSFKYDNMYSELAVGNSEKTEQIKQIAIEAEKQKKMYREIRKQNDKREKGEEMMEKADAKSSKVKLPNGNEITMEQYMQEILNLELMKRKLKLPNGVEIPAKQYIEEVVKPYIPQNGMFRLKSNGQEIPAKQFIEEYVIFLGQEKYNGDIEALMNDVLAKKKCDIDQGLRQENIWQEKPQKELDEEIERKREEEKRKIKEEEQKKREEEEIRAKEEKIKKQTENEAKSEKISGKQIKGLIQRSKPTKSEIVNQTDEMAKRRKSLENRMLGNVRVEEHRKIQEQSQKQKHENGMER